MQQDLLVISMVFAFLRILNPRTSYARKGRGSPEEAQANRGGAVHRAVVINGPPPVGLPLRQKAKGGAAALEGRLAGVEWGVLAALAA